MDLLAIAENAASEALVIGSQFRHDAHVLSSIYKDIKTEADIRMNECIIACLDATGIPVISEESDNDFKVIPDRCWVIDPLDGTYNFSRGYPTAGISISLWENNKPVIGVVADIYSGTIYSSSSAGAWLNGKVIQVSNIADIKDAVLATGFPSGASYETSELMKFVSSVQTFKKVRAIGSASLMLSYVAAGVFDVYYEKDIYLWDVAAGLSLVKEAGGRIFYRARPESMKYEVLACNALLFKQVAATLVEKEQ